MGILLSIFSIWVPLRGQKEPKFPTKPTKNKKANIFSKTNQKSAWERKPKTAAGVYKLYGGFFFTNMC